MSLLHLPRLRLACYSMLAAVVVLAVLYWVIYLFTPLSVSKKGFYLRLKPGCSINYLANTLEESRVLRHPALFIGLGRLKLATRSLQAGEYYIAQGTTPGQLIDQLVQGKVILYPFTIIEGWQFCQLLQALRQDTHWVHNVTQLSAEQLMQTLAIKSPIKQPASHLASKRKHPNLSALEGYFLPDTYFFPRHTTEAAILKRAHEAMQSTLAAAWPERDKGLPYTQPYQALIVASIVEKETSVPEERGRIAGVIVRRLKRGMKLQVDPTVIYALGSPFKGRLGSRHLRSKSRYNTYRYRGLPPTPIALPSRASLMAALHPSAGKSLYFVAKGDGSHCFSATLAAHQLAINRYRRSGKATKKQHTRGKA